ncbi:hypothetical protein NPIL_191811 [Nephila pilipes]|uniref:Uncharacterized protein n=1 Tax=Nephila pilipes TaxID=299642 RepID=A0A8X6PWG3_NEPPI|nr:hypothetical protein NPIL_191811 [Nephila pilipes]
MPYELLGRMSVCMHHAVLTMPKSLTGWTTDREILEVSSRHTISTLLVEERTRAYASTVFCNTSLGGKKLELSTCAMELNPSSCAVRRLLGSEGLYPFRYTTVQGLYL